jgi:hypothetical protein
MKKSKSASANRFSTLHNQSSKSFNLQSLAGLKPLLNEKVDPSSRVLGLCRQCKLINVSDRKRIMCPYCGSFYDPSEEKYLVRPRLAVS